MEKDTQEAILKASMNHTLLHNPPKTSRLKLKHTVPVIMALTFWAALNYTKYKIDRYAYPIIKNCSALEQIIEPKAKKYMHYILDACEKNKETYPVDPALFMSLIKAESEFKQFAISSVGAAGLCQLMPSTAQGFGLDVYLPEYFEKAKEIRSLAVKENSLAHKYLDKNWFESAKKHELIADRYFKESSKLFEKYINELKTKHKEDERFDPQKAIPVGVLILASNLKERKGDIREGTSGYNAGMAAVRRHNGIPPYDETVPYQNKIYNYYKEYITKYLKTKQDNTISNEDINLTLRLHRNRTKEKGN